MRIAIRALAVAAVALMGGAAQAGSEQAATAADKTAAPAAATAPVAKHVLYVCDEDAANWRSFSRDLGLSEFVTAKQVRAGKAGSGPKCITPSEMRRLTGGTQVGALSRTPPVR